MHKEIKLKSILISNFMGCRDFSCDFEQETTISGENGTGKSTIYDAFLWCLFGKNHKDEKDFYIKNTKDTSLNRQDHLVEVVLIVNDLETKFSKNYREVWTKKRGSEVAEFTKHETSYFVNDVPYQAGEYKNRIDSLISEDLFKILTNVYFFNEMDWKTRRKILSDLAEIKSDIQIAQTQEDFKTLFSALSGKSFEDYKKQLSERKKKLKEELDKIPIQINEATRTKQDEIVFYDQEYLDKIKSQIAELNLQKSDISAKNNAVYEKIAQQQKELLGLKTQLSSLEAARESNNGNQSEILKSELNALNIKIRGIKDSISQYDLSIKNNKVNIEVLAKQNDELRNKLAEIDSTKAPDIDENDCNCPTCKRRLDEDQIENKKDILISNFNRNKIAQIDQINSKGINNKKELENLANLLIEYDRKKAELETEISELQNKADSISAQIIELQNTSIASAPTNEELELKKKIESYIISESPKTDFGDLDSKILDLQKVNDECISAISVKENNKKIETRINELSNKESLLAKELSSIEKTEFVMQEFTKCKISEVEKAINDKFKYVSFKMYNQLINGGEEETCIPMYDDVPYQGVNTAGKINMGIDIINTLSNFYKIKAPIFIDNTESINTIIDTDLQLIKLQVSQEHKLTINHKKSLAYV